MEMNGQVLHAPAAVRLSSLNSRPEICDEEKNFLSLPGIKPLAIHPVAGCYTH
jgi:hypothetical protein